jgi:hypothetical protein
MLTVSQVERGLQDPDCYLFFSFLERCVFVFQCGKKIERQEGKEGVVPRLGYFRL